MKVLDYILRMLGDIFPEQGFNKSSSFRDMIEEEIDELALIQFLYSIEMEYLVKLPEELTDNIDMTMEEFAAEIEKLDPSDDKMFRYQLLKEISDEIAACYLDEDLEE
jgi:hypothetical protein